jgi:hypothetical protein
MKNIVTVLLAGFLAGALDITFAMTYYGLLSGGRIVDVLQSIASGLLGPTVYKGGWPTALLGLGIHFVIAVTMAGVYVALWTRTPIRRWPAWVNGALYGVLLYAIMSYVVVPNSFAGFPSPSGVNVMPLAAHIVLVGIPIAIVVSRRLSPLAGIRTPSAASDISL